jgi:acyl-CoA thioester hydrolase
VSDVFECEIQVRLRDVNLGGHVDSVEAIRVVDEARLLFLRYADLDVPGPRDGVLAAIPDDVSELVGSQRVDYHSEMRFVPFQPFLMRLWVAHIGRSSFTVATELRVAADHPPALVAETTVVCWDHAAQASWPIDDAVRAGLERYAGPPAALRDRPTTTS